MSRAPAAGCPRLLGAGGILEVAPGGVWSGQLLTLSRLSTRPACRGSGLVYVAYLDPSLRIFQASNGSLSLQVRQQELARLLGRPPAAAAAAGAP